MDRASGRQPLLHARLWRLLHFVDKCRQLSVNMLNLMLSFHSRDKLVPFCQASVGLSKTCSFLPVQICHWPPYLGREKYVTGIGAQRPKPQFAG